MNAHRKRFTTSVVGVLLMAVISSACAVKTTGAVKDDTTQSGESRRLAEAGAAYTGPQYVIGILTFENKTPSQVLVIGETATAILRTQFEQAGLKAVLLDETEIGAQQKLIDLQNAGMLKTGEKAADRGFDPIDYRVSGAVTAYSEVDEGVDTILYQRKTRVARVTVDCALVDVETGKALVVSSGAGVYKKTTTGSLGLGATSSYDANLRDGALRDALAKALREMITRLGSAPFRGKVLLVEDQSLLIRAGTRSQLGEGTELGVYQRGPEIRDPDSGEVLGRKDSLRGIVRIVRHQDENLSDAAVVSGSGFKPGDVVKKTP